MNTLDKPSENEEEYFARQEFERRRKWESERAEKMQVEERQKLKDLHFMKCPKCGMDLHSFEFKSITLDRCVSCNGTWFDAGEMEQLASAEDHKGFLSKTLSIFK